MYKLPPYLSWPTIFFTIFCLISLIQVFYYSWFFLRLALFRKPAKTQSQQHPVSVIICARDEAANLAENLPGALSQTYPSTHEVIVVNHNSQDDTRYLLEEFKKTFKGLHIVNLEYEAKGIPGKKYPLSMGIREARHEVLVLTDSDCIPTSEFWVEKMQDGYLDGTQIVLGYSAYKKKPGLLNKLIRFETFHSALQYLSYALAGQPYMGVGRNLSYKKELFLRNKGFSSINHVPGGDDDLFINKVATPKNTKIVIDPESFTLSEPKKTFSEWVRQKTRHYTTGKYYKARHKFLLTLYSISHILFYPAFVLSLVYAPWTWTLTVFLFRFLLQGFVYFRSMKKLGEADLFPFLVVAGYLDDRILHHLCTINMEEAARGMEIITRYFSDFTAEQIRQLEALEEIYREWNVQINVISRKDIGALYEKHVLHSLSIAAVFNFPPGSQVIDIGTGGGFPGIPLAIFFPDTQFKLVDSIAKKLKVVEAVVDALSLKNISTEHIRAEVIRDKKFDIAISRAVAPLKELWAWSRPLLRPRNITSTESDALPDASGLICLKGGDLTREISESDTRPDIFEIYELFPEESFREKYILQVPYQRSLHT